MSKNQIVVYQPNETVRLDVRLENETVWLNQGRIGELFGVDRTVVNRHIHNIYKTGELDEPSTCAKIAQVQNEGGRSITRQIPFYNLDMIIAVGYRVNSFAATQFRKWATTILREYLLRGYAFNHRLNALEDKVDRQNHLGQAPFRPRGIEREGRFLRADVATAGARRILQRAGVRRACLCCQVHLVRKEVDSSH